ncbi:hypothetical protein UCDDS831_g01017 [Diplodia seriata]|uniref:Uncharacterized protein n=1 Tax=Diplodia seriata TaxID=420778 RepID=A0A0G2EXR3_9PEZI|nr:hypothetical protein UCDDS831_g01017 [Diplodia seriata]
MPTITDAWAEKLLADQHLGDAAHDREVIETLRALLKRRISPQQAAASLAAAYDPLIRSGETSTANLWAIYCAAIAALGHDQSNLDLLVQTLLCVGRLPDVVDDDGRLVVTENGSVFWCEVPGFPFWLSQGSLPRQRTKSTASLNAAAFGSQYLRALDDRDRDHGPRTAMLALAHATLADALGRGDFDPAESDAWESARASLPLAATWILTAGRSIYRAARDGWPDGSGGRDNVDQLPWKH